MSYPITPDPSIHQLPASIAAQQQQQNSTEIQATANRLLQAILNSLLSLLTGGVLGTGSTSSANAVTFFTNLFGNFFKLLGISDPGSILGKIATDIFDPVAVIQDFINFILGPTGLVSLSADTKIIVDNLQQVIDAVVSGVNGASTVGNDIASVALNLLQQELAIPGNLLAMIFGQQATTTATVSSLQNGGFTHDFASNGVTGWNPLLGTLGLSSRGNYIQATTETVAYRSSGVTSATPDRYGAHVVVNPSMRGTCRIGICCDTAASSWVGLEVYRGFDGDSLRVLYGASPTLTVVKASADFTGTYRISDLTSLDIKTDGVNQITVLRNSQPVPLVLQSTGTTATAWNDGGLVAHNSTHRNVLLTSNAYNCSDDGSYGPAIMKVVSYGW